MSEKLPEYNDEKQQPLTPPQQSHNNADSNVITKQPETHNMSLVGPRNPKGLPVDENNERDWSHGICDIDTNQCCLAFWCPCMSYGYNRERFNYLREKQERNPEPRYGNQDSLTWLGFQLCCGVGFVFDIIFRADVRNRYKIKGNTCKDTAMVCFCTPCVSSQIYRELTLEEEYLQNHQNQKEPPHY